MDTGGKSQARRDAEGKFQQAQHQRERGHLARAEELAKEALEFDPTYNAVRLWLADLYMAQDEPYLASRQLQDAVLTDRDDQAAWEKLRQVDPHTAARLDRLGHIAPDPFVSTRPPGAAEEFDSLEDLAGSAEESEPEYLYQPGAAEDVFAPEGEEWAAAEPEPTGQPQGEVFESGEVAGAPTLPPEGPPPPPAPGAAPGPAATEIPDERGPAPWEYEQDRPYLARFQQDENVMRLVHRVKQVWSDLEAMRPVIDLCAHLERQRHPDIVEAAHQACQVLRVRDPELMVFAERCMHPVPLQDGPARLAIPTGLMRSMKGAEVVFQIGREVEYIRSGYLAEWQVADLIANRPSRLIGDVATALRELLQDLTAPILNSIPTAARDVLVKIAHAWQQRATLTADRAGWLCCGDVEAACRAIAKTTAATPEKALTTTLTGFLAQFQGQDPAALAAIDVKETPDRSVPYAAYRIKMLRWWASTPQAKALAEQVAR